MDLNDKNWLTELAETIEFAEAFVSHNQPPIDHICGSPDSLCDYDCMISAQIGDMRCKLRKYAKEIRKHLESK